MIITIDGPSGTGKSTIAKMLAGQLGISFFDTGAMYRAFAWWIDSNKMEDFIEAAATFSLEIKETIAGKRYFVGTTDVTDLIRSEKINKIVSQISAIKEVRDALLPMQRQYAATHSCVFEGRDLGTVVFPNADVKIFLTATSEVRALRRQKETPHMTVQEVLASLKARDDFDSKREIAPLICPKDALVIETSNLSLDQVLNQLVEYVTQK